MPEQTLEDKYAEVAALAKKEGGSLHMSINVEDKVHEDWLYRLHILDESPDPHKALDVITEYIGSPKFKERQQKSIVEAARETITKTLNERLSRVSYTIPGDMVASYGRKFELLHNNFWQSVEKLQPDEVNAEIEAAWKDYDTAMALNDALYKLVFKVSQEGKTWTQAIDEILGPDKRIHLPEDGAPTEGDSVPDSVSDQGNPDQTDH